LIASIYGWAAAVTSRSLLAKPILASGAKSIETSATFTVSAVTPSWGSSVLVPAAHGAGWSRPSSPTVTPTGSAGAVSSGATGSVVGTSTTAGVAVVATATVVTASATFAVGSGATESGDELSLCEQPAASNPTTTNADQRRMTSFPFG
jgi:hypothetical protein